MKRPSFQFYPADWSTDLALRRCSAAARGVWMDVLCALHNSDDQYGVLRWPLKEIAGTIGASMPQMRELVDKNVLKGSDSVIDTPLIYTPRHGRKDGKPVTLIDTQPGPLWYSKRLVKDEYIRTIRGESTRFGEQSCDAPKNAPKPPFGDGTTSSSSSSSSNNTPKPPPDGFDTFWEKYPKKVGKPAALKAFRSAKLNGHLPEVLADIDAKARSEAWAKAGGQFVPNPATYLNQRRWEDRIDTGPDPFAGSI